MTPIPTLSQLYNSVKSDIEAKFGDPIPAVGKIFLRAIAAVQAGKMWLFYTYLAYVQRNSWVDTADPISQGGMLERYGFVKLKRYPFDAVAGQYTVQVTGNAGAIIPVGTVFKSNDDSLSPGILYRLDSAFTFVSGTGAILLRALTTGLEGRLEVGDGLTATAPIANVDQTGVVYAETVQPLAAEDIEDYRAKAIRAYQLEAQGGAASDYRLWAADAQGVKEVYAFAASGAPRTTNLFVEATTVDSIDGHGTPSGPMLAAVQAVVEFDPDTTQPLNERGRRPLNVIVNYLPVTPLPVDIKITGFQGITADKQTLITNAITAALALVRPFVAGADVLADKNDTFGNNEIVQQILTVLPGSIFGSIEMKVNGVVTVSQQYVNGNIPYFNTLTFV